MPDPSALFDVLGKAALDPDTMFAQAEELRGHDRSRPPRRPHDGRRHALLAKWQRLWVPHMQRQWLGRIVADDALDDDGSAPQDDARDIREALTRHWGPAFTPTVTDSDTTDADIRRYTTPISGINYRPPDAERFRTILRRCKDGPPGPDGIPYSGWRWAGFRAHSLLARLALEAAATSSLPCSLNETVSVSTEGREAH